MPVLSPLQRGCGREAGDALRGVGTQRSCPFAEGVDARQLLLRGGVEVPVASNLLTRGRKEAGVSLRECGTQRPPKRGSP